LPVRNSLTADIDNELSEKYTSPKQFCLVRVSRQSAAMWTCRKPVQRNRHGTFPEGLPRSRSVACSGRSVRPRVPLPPPQVREDVSNRKKSFFFVARRYAAL